MALVLAALLTGCASNRPLPVIDNPVFLNGNDTANMPYGDANNIVDYQAIFKGYYLAYSREANNKRLSNQKADETTFYSTIIGVVGGIAKSMTTAIGGAAVAGGSSAYSDHYNMIIQADNYELAAEVMNCMYVAGKGIDYMELIFIQKTNENDIPAGLYVNEVAQENLDLVRAKLARLQASVQLGKFDADKFKKSINDSSAEFKAPTPAQAKLIGFAGAFVNDLDDTIYAVNNYKKRMDGCAAKLG